MRIFAKHISEKGFIPRIYKELFCDVTKKANNAILKMGKGLDKHFSKEDIQMFDKHKRILNVVTLVAMYKP